MAIGPRTFDYSRDDPEDLIYQIRFWSKIDVRSDAQCWDWVGGATAHGYGHFQRGRNSPLGQAIGSKIASRIAYYLANGGVPDGMVICHHCDRPICCNPAHLFAATQRENMHDMQKKGRQSPPPRNGFVPPAKPGEANPNALMNERKVLNLRERRAKGETLVSLADDFGVSSSLISKIAKGINWKHVGGPLS